jgi:hypothetical protein
MSINLSKITSICKQFSKEFGDTPEGQGYTTILKMLEMSGYSKPTTTHELFKRFREIVNSHGIIDTYPNIEIRIREDELEFKTWIQNIKSSIEGKSIKEFLDKLESVLLEKGEEARKNQTQKEDLQIS